MWQAPGAVRLAPVLPYHRLQLVHVLVAGAASVMLWLACGRIAGRAPGLERRALREVARLAPDLIVITGDYVAGPFFDARPAEAAARAFLSRLRAIAPVVVVPGHSEGPTERLRVFAGLDLVELDDTERVFELRGRRVRVVGLDPFHVHDPVLPSRKRAGEALLVLSHVPDVPRLLDGHGVDLHLAGHTHGGQVVVPFVGPPVTLSALPRRYARGLHRLGDHWINVCAGLGMEGNHAPRIRLVCPPEICLLTLAGGAA